MEAADTVLDKIFAELTTLQLETIEAHSILDILNIAKTKKDTIKYTLSERINMLHSRHLDSVLK